MTLYQLAERAATAWVRYQLDLEDTQKKRDAHSLHDQWTERCDREQGLEKMRWQIWGHEITKAWHLAYMQAARQAGWQAPDYDPDKALDTGTYRAIILHLRAKRAQAEANQAWLRWVMNYIKSGTRNVQEAERAWHQLTGGK